MYVYIYIIHILLLLLLLLLLLPIIAVGLKKVRPETLCAGILSAQHFFATRSRSCFASYVVCSSASFSEPNVSAGFPLRPRIPPSRINRSLESNPPISLARKMALARRHALTQGAQTVATQDAMEVVSSWVMHDS